MKNVLITLSLLLLFSQQIFATRYYVNGASGNNANNGKSWAQAFKTFQKAIDVSKANDEIWLAGGTYCPELDFLGSPGAPIRNLLFYIDKPLLIYGHFSGTETDITQRSDSNPRTILSGDFTGDDLASPATQASDIVGINTSRILDITITGATGKIRLDDIVFTGSDGDFGLLLGNCGSDVTVYNCSFSGNFASYTGSHTSGAVFVVCSSGKECSPVFDHCIFENNASESGPAALSIYGYGGNCKPSFVNSTFQYNTGYAGGAGYIYSNGMNTQVRFTGCDILHNEGGQSYGGAFLCTNTKLEFNSCTIQYNHSLKGGVIYATYMTGDNNLSFSGCGLAYNSASSGGAIALDNVDCTISGCEVEYNTAEDGNGGAILIDKSLMPAPPPNTLNCKDQTQFYYNQATGNGGAVCNMDFNTSTFFEHVKFLENTADNGGAFSLQLDENTYLPNVITQSFLVQNTANNGGAIYVKQEKGTDNQPGMIIGYSTLFGNQGSSDGDQIFADHGRFYGAGMILWTSTPGNSEIGSIHDSDLEIDYSLLYSPNCDAAHLNTCDHNIFGRDPDFEDQANLDFYLKKCSPAVNAAEYSQQNQTDLGGANRPYNDGTYMLDMGAYEYQGVSTNCVKALCKDVSVSLGANGTVNVPAGTLNNGSTGCTSLTFQIDNLSSETFNCSQVGDRIATLKVTDCMNNSASCNSMISIRDNIAPVMQCKPATISLNSSGMATLSVVQINNGSYDNCGLTGMSLSQTQFTCSNIGQNQVTLSGSDEAGNQGQCYATVTVQDLIAPVAKCRNSIANLNSNGQLVLAPASIDNGSTDNCSISLSTVPSTFNCGNVGVNMVSLRVMDGGGNMASCTATVTVRDITAPVARCKNTTVTLNNEGIGMLTVNQADNGSSDACGIASMTLSKTQFNCSDLAGSTQLVALTVKDVNNNLSTCQTQVTVKDNLAPTATCTNTSVQVGSGGTVTVYGSDLAANSFDNCSVWSYSPSAKTYTGANLGANNLTITVKDWSGNAASCVAVVNVLPYNGLNGDSSDRDKQSEGVDNLNFALFPNPTSGETLLNVELSQDQPLQLRVLDMNGRNVLDHPVEGKAGDNRFSIDLQQLPNSVYIVELRGKEILGQKRLVLQSN